MNLEVEQYQNELRDLKSAAMMAYKVMSDIHQVCDGAHHRRGDMHPYGTDCPVEKRFDEAWEALHRVLIQRTQP